MRRLIDDLQKTSNQGGHKVAIIYESERMNKESANAFLKTLEEPPSDTILFLLTHRPYDLIDTIKSRCLTYRIPADNVLETNELWESWKHSYWQWMSSLIQGYDRSKLGHLFLDFMVWLSSCKVPLRTTEKVFGFRRRKGPSGINR